MRGRNGRNSCEEVVRGKMTEYKRSRKCGSNRRPIRDRVEYKTKE